MISYKLRGSTLRVILFSLLVGLLQVTVFAQSGNTVQNIVRITVNSSSSTPLQGASVAIGWQDPSAGNSGLRLSTIATTGSDGVATIDIGAETLLRSIVLVEPPATSDDALWSDWFDPAAGTPQAMTVSLQKARVFYSIYNSITSPSPSSTDLAPIKTTIQNSDNDWETLLRPGEFGFSSGDTAAGRHDQTAVIPNVVDPANPVTARLFDAGFDGTTQTYGGRTYPNSSVTTDGGSTTLTKVLLGTHQGFKLFFNKPLIAGQLKTSGGSNYSFPTPSGQEVPYGAVYVWPAPGGVVTPPQGPPAVNASLNANGTFYIPKGLPEGQYAIYISGSGDYALPAFLKSPLTYFWVNGAGQASITSGTASFAAIQNLNITVPAAAFTYKISANNDGSGFDDPSAYLSISSIPNDQTNIFLMNVDFVGTPMGSILLPNGTYKFTVHPSRSAASTRSQKDYVVVISDGSVASITDSAGTTASKDGSLWIFNSALVNLRVRVTSNGTPLTANVLGELRVLYLRGDGGCCDGYGAQPDKDGIVSLALPTGSYFLESHPNDPSLVQTRFPVSVSVADGVSTITFTPSRTKDGNQIYSLPLDVANLTGVVKNKSGTPVGTDRGGSHIQVYANLTKINPNNPGDQTWIANSEVDINGNYSFSVPETGHYKVRVDIQGSTAYAPSESGDLNFSTLDPQTHNITLQPPTLLVKVSATSAAGSPISRWSGVQVLKDDQFVSNWNTDDSGVSAVLFDAVGTYKLRVDPPWNGSLPTATTKTYTVVVTSSDGNLSISSISDQAGNALPQPTSPSTQWALSLGTALFTGTVCTSSTGTCVPVSQSNVVAVDQATGQGLWQESANTNSAGTWGISVPDGTYKIYAKAPWNSATYADSDLTGVFTVAGGVITSGGAGSGIKLGLNQPYWTGTLKSPDGSQTIANGHLNLNLVIAGQQVHVDVNSDANGNWAIGKPAGFEHFDDFSNFMVRQEFSSEFAPLTLQGTHVAEKLPEAGPAADRTNIDLRLLAPNLTVHVNDPSSHAVNNVWVNVNSDSGWLGGSNTNASGDAKFSLSHAAITGKFQIQVDIGGRSDLAGIYAPTSTTISPTTCTDPCSKTVAFAVPNFQGWVKTPTGSANISQVWVDAVQDSTGQWVGGSNTNSSGYFSLNLPSSASTETYTVNTNPPWGTVSDYTRNTYKVGVDTGGHVTSVISVATTAVIESTTVTTASGYPLTLSSPSIKGYVNDASSNVIQNSQVTPIQISDGRENYLWQSGTNSGSTGAFALALPDGSYLLEANPAWGSTAALAKSAKCQISVSAQHASLVDGTRDNCAIDGSGFITLNLRAPNATIHINSPTSAPVPNSHVGMQWMTDNGSNQQFIDSNVGSNGIANFFINSTAIDAFSKGTPSQAVVNVWVDPPWGDTTVVRSQCRATYAQDNPAVDICQQIMHFAKTGTGTLDATIALQGPNTGVTVTLPGTSTPIMNAWVSILKQVSGQTTWLAGGNTDSSGVTKFNLPVPANHSDIYTVEVNAPWDKKDTYSTKNYQLTFTQLEAMNAVCALGSPNLVLTINGHDNKPNAFGWIGVEESNTVTTSWDWIGGYGLDQTAKAAITLPKPGTTYRVTAFPGGTATGVRTTKVFTTDGSDNVSSTQVTLSGPATAPSGTLTLSGGNVSGTVTKSGLGANAKGWVVYANLDTGSDISGNDATAIIASVGADGTYSLPLGAGSWRIKIIPTDGVTPGATGPAFTLFNSTDPYSVPEKTNFNLPTA